MINDISIENLKKRIYKIAAKPAAYNIFAGWNMSENDHTKILLSLLGYYERYGKDKIYPILCSFIREFTNINIGDGTMTEVELEFNATAQLENEKRPRYIDGLITFKLNDKKYALIIENKIRNAGDQQNQIRDYIKYVKNQGFNLGDIWVFYLPGDSNKVVDRRSYIIEGEEEVEGEQTNIKERFKSLAYPEEMLRWLKKDVVNGRVYPENIVAVARAYVDYLENDLFNPNKEIEKQDELIKLLFGEKDGKAVDLKDLESEQITMLYKTKSVVNTERMKYRKEDSGINDETEVLYRTLSSVIKRLEDIAFEQFEQLSLDVLNGEYPLPEHKDVKWRVGRKLNGHLGKGFLQLRLVDEYNTCHLEWHVISANMLLNGVKKKDNKYEYKVHIHMEGGCKPELKNCLDDIDVGDKEEGRVMRGLQMRVTADKPLAKMDNKELHTYLSKLYGETISSWCKMVVDKYREYAPNR